MTDVRERAGSTRESSSSRRSNGSERGARRAAGPESGREADVPFDRLTDPPAPKKRRRRPAGGLGGNTISRRLARILALPAVVVLALLALLAAGQVRDYTDSKDTSRSVKLALSVQDLVHELQTERGITAAVLGGNLSFRAELTPSRRLVDDERGVVSRLVAADGGVSDGARSRVGDALNQLDGLDGVRQETDSGKAARPATFAYFTQRITALSAIDVGLDNTADTELRRGAATLQALGDLAEATAQERAFLNGVFSFGGFGKGEFQQFATMRADRLAALDRFNRLATPSERRAMTFVFNTGAARVFADFEQVALDAADGHHIVVNPQSWWSGLTTVLDDLQQLQKHVGSEIQIRASDLQTGAAQRIGGLIGLVVVCFALSIYLARLASRSITRPLAALAAEADSVATERLPAAVHALQTERDGARPEPPTEVAVPDNATSEIRSVAGALDRLQTSAYGLATDQAVQRRDTIESMANLGRRNQNLIRRQLGFITSLEREEVDPAALANLFELDHLATRMRRNAASLLVLVDASTPRQWSTAVSVADMIRAAVSEVEEYRRVTLRRLDEAYVQGSAVGSIAHLLAELIENGLTFSPPDMDVEVQGRRLVDGYLIAITDQGVGMTSTDLDRANARLEGEGDFIAAPTRFLGHFVVGKLARETGVKVELLPSPATGITARVTLPAALLGAGSSVEVRAVTDQPERRPAALRSQPASTAAEVPAGSSHLLALPQHEDDTTGPQTPSPWSSPSFRRAGAHSTPPSGTPAAPAAAAQPVNGTGSEVNGAPVRPTERLARRPVSRPVDRPVDRPVEPAVEYDERHDALDPNRTPASGIPVVVAASTPTGGIPAVWRPSTTPEPTAPEPRTTEPEISAPEISVPQTTAAGAPDPAGPDGDPLSGEIPVGGASRPQWQPHRRGAWGSSPGLARPEWPDSGGMRLPGDNRLNDDRLNDNRFGGDRLGTPAPPAEIDLRDSGELRSVPVSIPGSVSGSIPTSAPSGAPGSRHGAPSETLPGGRAPGEERTQNGLRKRTPRSPRPESGATAGLPQRSAARPPSVGGSATDVGARMTALRAGLQRGHGSPQNGSSQNGSSQNGSDQNGSGAAAVNGSPARPAESDGNDNPAEGSR